MQKYTRAVIVTKTLEDDDFVAMLLTEIEKGIDQINNLPFGAIKECSSYISEINEKLSKLNKRVK